MGIVVTGTTGNDTLNGDTGDDTLYGFDGNDTLNGGAGADTMVGGAGDDLYTVDNAGDVIVEAANEGDDRVNATITWTLGDNTEDLFLYGAAANGTGNGLDNVIYGNDAANILSGLDGNDILFGHPNGFSGPAGVGAADTMIGGTGNDHYYVDNIGDTLIEAANAGTDTVTANVDWTLGSNFENLYLSAGVVSATNARNGTGNALDNVITGNGFANTLSGLAGNDTLDGGAGNDTLDGGVGNDKLLGGLGDDTLIVGTGSDSLDGGDGFDTMLFTQTTIADWQSGILDASVANSTWANWEAIRGSAGNDVIRTNSWGYAVTLYGGDGNDTLATGVTGIVSDTLYGEGGNDNMNGGAGDDTLDGGTGNDTLDGGVGNDTLLGGVGDDTLIVGTGSDSLDGGAGFDTMLFVQATVADWQSGILDAPVADSTWSNWEAIRGSAGNDVIRTNSWGYAVTLYGGDGNDTLATGVTGIVSDTLYGEGGNDNMNGGAGDDTLDGGTGNDTLDGGVGNDTMKGGLGDDIYVVDSIGDKASEAADQGVDTVQSAVTWTLGSNFEKLILTGSAAINGIGNALANTITGNGAANTLSGLAGADTMIGGAGDDTYIVDDAGDKTTEAANGGTDMVKASVTWTLGNNVENLNLTGTATIDGTGNALANTITGNAGANALSGLGGNDTIDGGGGADTMSGGIGDDIYIVDDAGDKTIEAAGQGIDSVQSAVTWTLSDNVENLTLKGTAAIDGTGNALANTITGNAGDNSLQGGAGNDTLSGGAGNDTLDGGLGKDRLTGGAGSDKFVFSTAPNAATNIDSILDFNPGQDTIQLAGAIFSALLPGTLSAADFVIGTAATTAAQNIVYDKTSGKIFYDADGAGGAAQVQFASVNANLTLTAGNFVVT